MISLLQPSVSDADLAGMEAVVRSKWIGPGPVVDQFVLGFAKHAEVDAEHLVPLASCSDGIFIAMRLLDLHGGEVVVPTIHFGAAAQAVIDAGGKPVLCDVDPRTLNATAETIRPHVTSRTRAVFLLHYGGIPIDVHSVTAEFPKLTVIEDAAAAVDSWSGRDRKMLTLSRGSWPRKIVASRRPSGNLCGTSGDIGLWSFDPVKQISAANGGMLWCRNAELADRAKRMARLGMTFASGLGSFAQSDRWWETDIREPGRNSLWNDVAASMAIGQLRRIEETSKDRLSISKRYAELLTGLPITLPEFPSAAVPYFFWIQTDRRDELAKHLKNRGIYTTFRYWPLHRMSISADDPTKFPGAEEAAAKTILLPLHSGLSESEINTVAKSVAEFFGRDIQC